MLTIRLLPTLFIVIVSFYPSMIEKAGFASVHLKDTSKSLSGDTTEANRLLALCEASYDKGDYNTTLTYSRQALKISESLKFSQGISKSLIITANCLFQQGKYRDAVPVVLRSRSVNDSAGNKKGTYFAFLLLGNIYFRLADYNKASYYFKEAGAISTSINYTKGTMKSLMNLAAVNIDDNKADTAVMNLHKALEIALQINDQSSVSAIYVNMGVTYYDRSGYDSALKYYNKALQWGKKSGDRNMIATAELNIGSALVEKGELTGAEQHLKRSMVMAKELGARYMIAENYRFLADLFDKKKDYRQALMYARMYFLLMDSLRSQETKETIEQLNLKYNSEKKDQNIQLLKKENENRQTTLRAAIKTKRLVLTASGIIIGMLVIIFLGLFRNSKLRHKEVIARMEKEKLKSDLTALRSQLDPHVIFNSLNTIYHQIEHDPQASRQTILDYADLLRYQLYKSNVDFIEMDMEISYLHKYITLQKLRISSRCKVSVFIEDDFAGIVIAPLLLVSVVENTFKHVSNTKNSGNFINITLIKKQGGIVLCTRNTINAPDYQESLNEKKEGIGLANLKNRLMLIYPERHKIETLIKDDVYEVNLFIDV